MNLKSLIKYIFSYVPEALPVGLSAMDAFMKEIIELCGNYADEDSMRWAIASMIQHADSNQSSFSKQYFVRRLRKSAANQVAAQIFVDIKEKQRVKAEAEKLAASSTEETTKQAANENAPTESQK